jgi:hypothetical protein
MQACPNFKFPFSKDPLRGSTSKPSLASRMLEDQTTGTRDRAVPIMLKQLPSTSQAPG